MDYSFLIEDTINTAHRNYISMEGIDKTFWNTECTGIAQECIGILNKLLMTGALTVPQEYRTKLLITQFTEMLSIVVDYKNRLALLEEAFMFPPSPPSQHMR